MRQSLFAIRSAIATIASPSDTTQNCALGFNRQPHGPVFSLSAKHTHIRSSQWQILPPFAATRQNLPTSSSARPVNRGAPLPQHWRETYSEFCPPTHYMNSKLLRVAP